ncbi:MAG: DUF2924 domain-containing protein [Methylococcaceae bacterium]|nr:DUF2924 domain-containing protein [Methylococcaceae bacterium]
MNVNLSELMALDRDELVSHWQNVFGHPAPERCREEFLRQALGWKLQSDAHGKLSGNELRSLRDRSSSKRNRPCHHWNGLVRARFFWA